MLHFLVRRTIWAGVLFLAVTVVTYVIFFVIPADPAALMAGRQATPEHIERAREYLGLDKPVYQQYVGFLKRLVVDGSLGRSFANRQEVNDIVLRAAPVTASLVFGGMIITLLIAIPIGVLSALRPRSLLDRATTVVTLAGISTPSFFLGLVLAYLVSFRLGVTPISGYCDVFDPATGAQCGGVVDWAYYMALPWTTLALLSAAAYIRFIRSDVMEQLASDHVRTARAKGAGEATVIVRHVLRNSMLVVVTLLGLQIGELLGGAIFIEQVFGLPGLGDTALTGVTNYDLPTTMGVVVFGTLAIIACVWIVDVLYAWIDPRIRLT